MIILNAKHPNYVIHKVAQFLYDKRVHLYYNRFNCKDKTFNISNSGKSRDSCYQHPGYKSKLETIIEKINKNVR